MHEIFKPKITCIILSGWMGWQRGTVRVSKWVVRFQSFNVG